MNRIKIKHPDRLAPAFKAMKGSIELQERGLIPESIQGWMFVVPCRHLLRAIYGSDLKAAWALMKQAVAGLLKGIYHYQLHPLWHRMVLQKTAEEYSGYLERKLRIIADPEAQSQPERKEQE